MLFHAKLVYFTTTEMYRYGYLVILVLTFFPIVLWSPAMLLTRFSEVLCYHGDQSLGRFLGYDIGIVVKVSLPRPITLMQYTTPISSWSFFTVFPCPDLIYLIESVDTIRGKSCEVTCHKNQHLLPRQLTVVMAIKRQHLIQLKRLS